MLNNRQSPHQIKVFSSTISSYLRISRFYDSGYQDGFAHGRIHGLIEGRALGCEKGFEMWEELGFYEGFALTWRAILVKQTKQDDRPSQHIRNLLDLISQFPKVNPSTSPTTPTDDTSSAPSPEVDISKLLSQIRSRYKVLCSSLGVRPRLQSSSEAATLDSTQAQIDAEMGDDASSSMPTDGSQPQPRGSSIPVWKIDNTGFRKPVTNQDLSF
ncbi:hypothetical protein GALMADRAFT_52033 [Galerina marginata CBS 339.88]|uniref:Essential protein Yae1 N-terminal domain-containing protein n=1 Tax=Galerina marginata (strain CBS 339.88) TaxID=685588 RepID=A0A067TRU5_GALM3|nr:hypothetical protein GALMADRAFT_52033 [Galerina marginata CBS 339.88]